MIPADVRTHCQLCPHVADGLEAIVAHIEATHPEGGQDYMPERWPDGGLVIDEDEELDVDSHEAACDLAMAIIRGMRANPTAVLALAAEGEGE